MRESATVWVKPFWDVIDLSRQAFMAVALLTMGAQLATVKPGERDKAVSSSVAIRMVVSPLVGLGVVWMLGLHGLPAQVLLISTAAPAVIPTSPTTAVAWRSARPGRHLSLTSRR